MTKPVVKKPAAKKAVAKRAPKKPVITARIKLMGQMYEAKGANIMEALEGLNAGRNARGRGILIMSNGTRTVEKIINPRMVARLFSLSPLMRQTQLKNLYLLFNL